mmetsp:Transcript_4906/g.14214  ORF Transcript_4906/g.14214 Transcript_4906/m.14214 type:complete len:210 (+) Transcript_4906:2822-3451(+)
MRDCYAGDATVPDHLHGRRVWLVALGAGAHKIKLEAVCQPEPRVHNVVPIADIHDLKVLIPSKMLFHGQDVRHDLTRMVVVSEAVDHRHGGILCEIDNILVVKEAGHDDVVVPAQDPGDVLRGLPAAELDRVWVEVDGVPPEPIEPRLEAHPGAHRGLREYHRHGLSRKGFERLVALPELLLGHQCRVQHGDELLPRKIVNVQKMVHAR